MDVIKRSGEHEEFSEEKVLSSMERVGVPIEMRPLVLNHIKTKLHDGIGTEEIFAHIKEYLQGKNPKASLRFNLKQAIFDLGPTGFPFERYIERIFKDMGYETRVDVQMRGECVMHEVDIVLDRDGKREIVEVKFHNQPGIKTNIHVAMYTWARFQDVSKNNKVDGVWLVTNTKLSEDATIYAQCKGIKTIAWNYPKDLSLQNFVENPEMYPITILPEFTISEQQSLLENAGVVLTCDLLDASEATLAKAFINHGHLEKALESAKTICGN